MLRLQFVSTYEQERRMAAASDIGRYARASIAASTCVGEGRERPFTQ